MSIHEWQKENERLIAEVERLTSRLRDRQNALDHAIDYGHRMDRRIAKLEVALYPIGKLGYDQTPRELGMSVKALHRIRVLAATEQGERDD